MKISIIIPTYNVENYIVECLRSVAKQTYTGEIECIVVDDCGTDNSVFNAESFISSYKGNVDFQILHREKNGGLSAARNSGLSAATGNYIYFLDSDDCISDNCLEKLIDLAMKYPLVDLVQGGMVTMKGRLIYQPIDLQVCFEDSKDAIFSQMVFGDIPASSCNKLFRRDFLVSNNIRFYEGVIHEDVDFIYKVARHITSVAFCDELTYFYREQREGSILTSSNDEKSTKSRILVYDNCLRQMEEKYRQPLTRSLFLRAIFVLQTAKLHGELKHDFSLFCKRLANEALASDAFLMRSYFMLPAILQHRLYGIFYKKFKK